VSDGLPHVNFGDAIAAVKIGHRISRAGWNGKGMFVFLVKTWTFTDGKTDNQPLLPFLAMQTVTGAQVPWLASQTDILAEDWTIL